ncbi:MAG: hypothetical protein FJ403_23115 [Verrucomicrobia bacterium]|nr:hypothetical protein [Verrucomicrobiota bacterium]
MSIWPVIVRELQSQARQPLTYWLRVLGGISVAAAFGVALWKVSHLRNQFTAGGAPHSYLTFGTALFGKLNLFIFLVIWIFVPLSTADAISRERREGTLALLYLTKLRSWGIVAGKASVHVLRALSLFLTVAPWLMLPLLFGGVGVKDVGLALMINFAALLLALAAELLASTVPRDWLKSVILAQLFALILFVRMLYVHEDVLKHAIISGTAPAPANAWMAPMAMTFQHLRGFQAGMLRRMVHLIEITTNSSISVSHQWGFPRSSLETHWQVFWSNLTPGGHQAWSQGVAGMIVRSAFVLLIALAIAAWRVQNSWRDAPPQLAVEGWKRRFFHHAFASTRFGRIWPVH